jgi:hypothetical protein
LAILHYIRQDGPRCKPGNTNWKGRLSTASLPIMLACFVEEIYTFSIEKATDLN